MRVTDIPSSHEGDEPHPVNPYAASQIPDPIDGPGPQRSSDGARDYHAQLTWSDRRAFLRAVAFDRFVIIGTALWWLKYIFDLLQYWSDYLSSNALTDSYGIAMVPIAVLAVIQGAFVLYLCTLSWRNVNYLRDVTGGTTGNFHNWSQMSLRTARYGAVSMLLMLVVDLGTWLVQRLHA